MPKMNIPRPIGQLPKPIGYPDRLDADGLADHVITMTPGDVDEEFIREFFRDCRAELVYLPINELHEGAAENHVRIERREKAYAKMSMETLPPIVIERGEIQDGNHRYRVAKRLGASGMWCYSILDEDIEP